MPSLLVLQGPDKGTRFRSVDGKPVLLGRANPDSPLTDFTVSRRHAQIKPTGRGWSIEDLRSANGTYLNGKRLERPTRLKHGDQIRLGGTILEWDASEETSPGSPTDSPTTHADLIELDAGADRDSAAILGAVSGGDDSMILASPAAAEAVRSWRVISAILEVIGGALSATQLVERVADLVFEEIPADRIFVLLRNPGSRRFDQQFVRRKDESHDRTPPNKAILRHVLEKHEGVVCSDSTSDPRFAGAEQRPVTRGIGLQSVICVPLVAREDVLGAIYAEIAMAEHIYTDEQLRLVAAIGRMAGLVIEHIRLLDQRMQTERLAAAGETVAALSHHIKNILQGMRGGSDVVEMGLRAENWSNVQQGWEIVQRNLDRIYSLCMNMLAFAKRRTPRRAPVQLNALVEEVLKLTRHRAEEKGVLLKGDLHEMLPAAMMDEDGIQQVVLNIANNAIDAVEKDAGVVTLKTSLTPDGENVVVSIGDNGCGISESARARIFEAFYSTKGHGGTGLGLAVAKKTIDEHGGRIEVQSTEGEGTLFRITLPVSGPGDIDSAATRGPAEPPKDDAIEGDTIEDLP